MAFQALKLACSGQQLFIPWANLPKSPMVTLNPEHSPPWGRRIGGCAHEVVQHAFSRGALFRALCFFLREVKSSETSPGDNLYRDDLWRTIVRGCTKDIPSMDRSIYGKKKGEPMDLTQGRRRYA